MKSKLRIVIIFLVVLIVATACGKTPPATLEENSIAEQSSALEMAIPQTVSEPEPTDKTDEPEEIGPALEQPLAQDDLESGVAFFLYLLEHYDEVKSLMGEREDIPYRFRHILYVYERDGLSTAVFEVYDCQAVDLDTLLSIDEEVVNKYNRPIYLFQMDVGVVESGELSLPEGRQIWLGSFLAEPEYIDFILPYDSALNRLEADTVYREYTEWACLDARYFWEPFDSQEDIPVESLLFYLLCMDISEENYISEIENDLYGTVLTQEEIDARAKRYFNLDHVDGTETSFYLPDRELYYMQVWGAGGPVISDVLKVEQEGSIVHVYYDLAGYLTDYLLREEHTILKYSYQDEILLSIERVSSDLFQPMILTGENGG